MNSTRFSNNLHLCSLFSLFLLPALSTEIDDATCLLAFKTSILSDPFSVLKNWTTDSDPCTWNHVLCTGYDITFGRRVNGLSLPNYKLLGSIPQELLLIRHLKTLDLSSNFLNVTFPSPPSTASELEFLSLSNNAISGEIPEFILGLKGLKHLNLSGNLLVGNIPINITSLQNLQNVSLKSNNLSGPIPSGIHSIEILDLSSNFLNGSLPPEFGGESLRYLNLSSNKLSGQIPPEFAKEIPENVTIDLSFNYLSREIPDSKALSNQKPESYAGNPGLCGKPVKKLCVIPSTHSSPPNDSKHTAPPALAAEPLTPSRLHNGLKHHRLMVAMVVSSSVAIGVLGIISLYIYQKRKNRANAVSKEGSSTTTNARMFKKDAKPSSVEIVARNLPTWPCISAANQEDTSEDETSNYTTDHPPQGNRQQQIKNEKSLVMVDGETELELETLLKASAYVLGSSGASIVYKAVLQDGSAFAVRRIGQSGIQRPKDFESKVRLIAKLQHPNLVRVRGFYWGDEEKLVLVDYISNGTLANVGCRRIGSSPIHLSVKTRLKIARGVARGLSFIHQKKNVHGNIKPSNILLTEEMEPIISDFGLDWLICGKNNRKTYDSGKDFVINGSASFLDDPSDRHVNGIELAGFMGPTNPYRAPDSLIKPNSNPNPKWDVYSYGILLLELLTGRVFADRDELSLWNCGSDPNRVSEMADVAIRGELVGHEDAMLAWLKLGFECASWDPRKRPSMKYALALLEKYH